MGVQIFLGYPPSNIKKWIEDHAKTKIMFSDGSSETYKWSGEINRQTMIDAGLYDSNGSWIKQPQTVDIGNIVTSIGEWVFDGCSELTGTTIPNSVTSIGIGALCYCEGLTNMTIPDSVTSIGNSAFYYCRGLTSVTIGDSVTSIGDYAFGDCSGLMSVTIPDSVTSIGDSAFFGCSSLTSVTIVANGGNADAVKEAMISAGVSRNINWIMPNT